jgi:hypothetical protein
MEKDYKRNRSQIQGEQTTKESLQMRPTQRAKPHRILAMKSHRIVSQLRSNEPFESGKMRVRSKRGKHAPTCVTAVTEGQTELGDTPVVNMVRGARTNAPLEPGDTRQQWKGEAAASFG